MLIQRIVILWAICLKSICYVRGNLIDSSAPPHNLESGINSSLMVPYSWYSTCSWVKQQNNFVEINCFVPTGKRLNFIDFRLFTSKLDPMFSFSVTIKCQKPGKVFLPYPGRARLLVSLKVTDCFIDGYKSERKDYTIDLIPDMMKYLVLKDSVLRETYEERLLRFKPERDSLAFECGPLNAIEITESGLRNIIPTSLIISKKRSEENRRREEIERVSNSPRCRYPNLRLLDRSKWHGVSRQRISSEFQVKLFPVLEVLNLSSNGILEIPVQLYEWGLYLKNLRYLDLSHNYIKSDFNVFKCNNGVGPGLGGIVDLRYNKIQYLKGDSLKYFFGYMCNNHTVYLQNNPFTCDCYIKDLVDFLRGPSNFSGRHQYDYLNDLTCQSPSSLLGKVISGLTMELIGCKTVSISFYKAPIIGISICLLVFIILLVLCFRYRKEIEILAYTRLQISLLGRRTIKGNIKKYDAFVAYSEADVQWVVHTLAKRLENPDNGQSFKLCLHHRDFVIGAAIADNIVESVESSRHTIIVVSNNFLKSEWCLLEFRTALHQSLLERQKHLIIVLLGEVLTRNFEPELKRCIQTLTYVKAEDRWFWDKLVFALSERSKHP